MRLACAAELRAIYARSIETFSGARRSSNSVAMNRRARIAEFPFEAVKIDLVGDGQMVALVTPKAVDELGFGDGDQVFAFINTIALDECSAAVGSSRRDLGRERTSY